MRFPCAVLTLLVLLLALTSCTVPPPPPPPTPPTPDWLWVSVWGDDKLLAFDDEQLEIFKERPEVDGARKSGGPPRDRSNGATGPRCSGSQHDGFGSLQ